MEKIKIQGKLFKNKKKNVRFLFQARFTPITFAAMRFLPNAIR